jgi:hypothetical protein
VLRPVGSKLRETHFEKCSKLRQLIPILKCGGGGGVIHCRTFSQQCYNSFPAFHLAWI